MKLFKPSIMIIKKFTLLIIFTSLLTSCYNYKRLIYIRDDAEKFSDRPTVIETTPKEYLLNVNDVLSINVQSPEPDVSNIFNLNSGQGNSYRSSPMDFYLMGYIVNNLGNIKLPIIGDIYVKDLSIGDAQRVVQEEVNKYLKQANVIIKLLSFKITVLGEVARPGYFYIYNGQANIFEALGLAGDVTELGKKEGVKLFRQTRKGTEVVLIDLTDPRFMKSDYYYVQPNDIIYVEPFKANTKRTNLEMLTYLSIIFSAISATLLILNYFASN